MDDDILIRKCPPLSGHDLDKFNYHVHFQGGASAIFPSDQNSSYTKVDVIILSWEDEDLKLPVSLDIKALADFFSTLNGFQVGQWLIPSDNSHNELQKKILKFLGDNDVAISRLYITRAMGS
jgi:hypothetical protein